MKVVHCIQRNGFSVMRLYIFFIFREKENHIAIIRVIRQCLDRKVRLIRIHSSKGERERESSF